MQFPINVYHVFFREADSIFKLNAIDIILFEASAKYVNIITFDNKYFIRAAMIQVEKSLLPQLFCRVHRSYIINLHHVSRIYKDHIIMGERSVPLGDEYAGILMERLALLN